MDERSDSGIDTSVPDWIIEHPETLPVFEALGIDYSCGGKSLAYACEQRGLNLRAVLAKLQEARKKPRDSDATIVIPTANLDLVLQTPDKVLEWVESLPPGDRAEVSPDWIARVRSTAAGDPWSLSFEATERASGSVVGACAFKGPPDAEGVVEIAYGIDETHRGRGFATEAAEALTTFAFQHGQVRLVRAHTKRENPASARVLAKCGFHSVGEVIDPEDGLVCRWERSLE